MVEDSSLILSSMRGESGPRKENGWFLPIKAYMVLCYTWPILRQRACTFMCHSVGTILHAKHPFGGRGWCRKPRAECMTSKKEREVWTGRESNPHPSSSSHFSELGHGNSYTLKGTLGSCSPPPSTLNISTLYIAIDASKAYSIL